MKKTYTYIGKLNKNLLGEYKEKIINEYVILTDERRRHIISRHIEVYDEILYNIDDILYNPDYILADNQNNDTLLIIKKINVKNNNLIIVVKLNTNKNAVNIHNSILTFWRIRNRSLKKQLEKQKIIYQKNVAEKCINDI